VHVQFKPAVGHEVRREVARPLAKMAAVHVTGECTLSPPLEARERRVASTCLMRCVMWQ
jgi:hypothetical protein